MDPATVRARNAATAFRAAAGSGLANALAEYLAARLHCPAAAVIAPDLRERLVTATVPDELATRAATLLESLVAARYGGNAPSAEDAQSAAALVDELEAVLRSGRT